MTAQCDCWKHERQVCDVCQGPSMPDAPTEERGEYQCPACGVERADYEGAGKHLPTCPNCGSGWNPIATEERSEGERACDRCDGEADFYTEADGSLWWWCLNDAPDGAQLRSGWTAKEVRTAIVLATPHDHATPSPESPAVRTERKNEQFATVWPKQGLCYSAGPESPAAKETCNGVTPPHDECAGGECSRTPAPTGEGMNPGELGTPVRFEIETADGWIVRFEGDDAARHVEALDAACALATLHGAAFPTALPTIGRKLVACLTCGGDGRTVLGKPCPDCTRHFGRKG